MFGNNGDAYDSKYSKVLTIVLIVVIIGVLALLGFLGYDIISKMQDDSTNQGQKFNEMLDNTAGVRRNKTNTNGNLSINILDTNTGGDISSSRAKTQYYEGYAVAGKLEIPAINLEYMILADSSAGAIEVAVALSYTQNGLNEPGNSVIIGHNYRNGSFFGNNDKLKNGDTVYVTDMTGRKIKYKIYNIYKATPEESDYYTKDTNGAREVILATCTDDSKERLVIWAREAE